MNQFGIVLLGLATASMYGQTADPLAAAKAACGPADAKYRVTTTADKSVAGTDEGKAQLYLLEVQDRVAVLCPGGCGQTVKLGLDGGWAGVTKGNSYLVLPVEPGQHHLCAEWDPHTFWAHQHLELAGFSAEPGKSYYFRVHITPPTTDTVASFRFEPVNEDEGKLLFATRPRSVWTKK